MKITVKKMLDAEACWPTPKLEKFIGKGITGKQLLKSKIIFRDKVFALSMTLSKTAFIRILNTWCKKKYSCTFRAKYAGHYFFDSSYSECNKYDVALDECRKSKEFIKFLAKAVDNK